ncbi:MAG: DUF488 domain-containing protein [Gemmatimonadaceae bacterium]
MLVEASVPTVFTIGHSTRSWSEFLSLLEREGVREVVDIRTYPGSRRYPHFNSEVMGPALRAGGAGYRHAPALGGRRKPVADGPTTRWRNEGFRGYAHHMATDAFRHAIADLLTAAHHRPATIMCSEAVPWRCHRTLVADALVARGVRVLHIMDTGNRLHVLTPFAALDGDQVRYDGEGMGAGTNHVRGMGTPDA